MVVHGFNPNTWKADGGREFQASQDYIVKTCVKK